MNGHVKAVTAPMGHVAPFIRLVWEGLVFEFPETPRREWVIYRGVELSEAVESYRDHVGRFCTCSVISSLTEKCEEAEAYGIAWRGGTPMLFELRSVWCPRPRKGTHLQYSFALLQVEAVEGSAVKLAEVELLEPAPVTEVLGRRQGVIPQEGLWTSLQEAAICGDIQASASFASRPELNNGRDAERWVRLAVAANYRLIEAARALLGLGANVNARGKEGATALFLMSQEGHDS
jgi:hypothetical protein